MVRSSPLEFAHVVDLVAARRRSRELIAIDGLPLSGKSTLATMIHDRLGITTVGCDDFFLPRHSWPSDIQPAFPFSFFRMDEVYDFLDRVAASGRGSYHPYDWELRTISASAITVDISSGPLIIEGCSVLAPELAPRFALSFFVESDAASILSARRARDGTGDEEDWEKLFLPSVEMYMRTDPASRATHVVAGRGWSH